MGKRRLARLSRGEVDEQDSGWTIQWIDNAESDWDVDWATWQWGLDEACHWCHPNGLNSLRETSFVCLKRLRSSSYGSLKTVEFWKNYAFCVRVMESRGICQWQRFFSEPAYQLQLPYQPLKCYIHLSSSLRMNTNECCMAQLTSPVATKHRLVVVICFVFYNVAMNRVNEL